VRPEIDAVIERLARSRSWPRLRILDGARLDEPAFVDGARACPPEDCGGAWGYAELGEILADPARVEHADRRTWAGEQWHPEAFDVQKTKDPLALYDRLTGGN
jgi:hypothetical protein